MNTPISLLTLIHDPTMPSGPTMNPRLRETRQTQPATLQGNACAKTAYTIELEQQWQTRRPENWVANGQPSQESDLDNERKQSGEDTHGTKKRIRITRRGAICVPSPNALVSQKDNKVAPRSAMN